ncbi:STAS domain-containing protein [Actinacidiphila paucisporea]|uniref:Anti-anti-sigma factor n=1 Tax=Actinacidiphila paucisporea TaxID=310782 RepID=A0A1M7FYQ0_9ACTN|nr:STAS domain-containing protein [Actinacidiphila paucisporea]SHM09204.1 anti-anti-sigma factor [Actinacidiphila paucisporea]
MSGGRSCSIPPARSGTVTVTSATRAVRVVRHLRSGLVMRLTEAGGLVRVAVHGEVDLDCADLLEHVLTDALRSSPDGLHLDLSGVGFFDCAGLNTLLRARALAVAEGREMSVTSASAAVARVLDLTRTWPAFTPPADARVVPADALTPADARAVPAPRTIGHTHLA